jgi:eukaryotic-like serine/threonine-protein kinase
MRTRVSEPARDAHAVHAVRERDLFDGETIDVDEAEDVAVTRLELVERVGEGLLERRSVSAADLRELGIVLGGGVADRSVAVVILSLRALRAHRGMHDDRAEERTERSLPRVRRDAGWVLVRTHEELLAHALTNLVGERRVDPQPREGASEIPAESPLDLGDRSGIARCGRSRELEVRRARCVRRHCTLDGTLRPMDCLDAAALAGVFVDAQSPLRAAVEAHLDTCSACRSLVALYAQLEEETRLESTVSTEREPASEAAASQALEPGDVIAQRYVLDRVVGEGGMGVVWSATDRVSGARVALKTLKAPSPDLCRRIVREGRVAAAVAHPNVLEVRSVVPLPDGSPALVMDLLDGVPLSADLASHGGKLDAHAAVAILLPLVSAVRAAHAKGIVHRDLKPANVFLARDGSGDGAGAPPIVMLLDFGLAKAIAVDDEAAEKITRSGAIVGTPHYMAPEQLFGERSVDARADVWSIGAMAYELLSGRKPLDGRSYAQLVKSATKGVTRSLAQLAPQTPAPLADIVMRMLSIDPGARPAIAVVHTVLDALAEELGVGS